MKSHLQIEEVDVKRERRRRRVRVGALLAAGLVMLAAGATLAWYLTPPALPTTLEGAVAVVNSPRFQRLGKAEKQPYYDVIREQFGSLDRDQRRAMMTEDEAARRAMQEAGEVLMRQMIHRYILASPEERQAMEAMFRNRRGRSAAAQTASSPGSNTSETQPSPQANARPRDTAKVREHINDRLTNGDAQMNQFVGEFFKQHR